MACSSTLPLSVGSIRPAGCYAPAPLAAIPRAGSRGISRTPGRNSSYGMVVGPGEALAARHMGRPLKSGFTTTTRRGSAVAPFTAAAGATAGTCAGAAYSWDRHNFGSSSSQAGISSSARALAASTQGGTGSGGRCGRSGNNVSDRDSHRRCRNRRNRRVTAAAEPRSGWGVTDMGAAAGLSGCDADYGSYGAAGMYGMSDDDLLGLLWQSAGLRALEFAPALPHMAASQRYMQLSPDNFAAWVSLLVDMEVQSPAAVLAPCPAFLLVPLSDADVSHDGDSGGGGGDGGNGGCGGPRQDYGAACCRFVGHLRDRLLMEEGEVFGLLARHPPLALVSPDSVDEAIIYLSVVIKTAGRGYRLGQPPGMSGAHPTAALPQQQQPLSSHHSPELGSNAKQAGMEGPAPSAAQPVGTRQGAPAAGRPETHDRLSLLAPQRRPQRQEQQQSHQHHYQLLQQPQPHQQHQLSEEAELDEALYRFLRRAPTVLAMTREELSYVLQRLSYDAGLDHTDMCRLLCAVPELLPAVAGEVLSGAKTHGPAEEGGSARHEASAMREAASVVAGVDMRAGVRRQVERARHMAASQVAQADVLS